MVGGRSRGDPRVPRAGRYLGRGAVRSRRRGRGGGIRPVGGALPGPCVPAGLVAAARPRGRPRSVAGGVPPRLPVGEPLPRGRPVLDVVLPDPRQPVPRSPASGTLVAAHGDAGA